MNADQMHKLSDGQGFIAALDQSGGSTPKALENYGIKETAFSNDEEMFDLVHKMRTRIMTSPAFTGEHILGAILFEGTMERQVQGQSTADYLWEQKKILSFLKIDKGLEVEKNGVQLLKPIPHLKELLTKAREFHVFGTKERSVINMANAQGIREIVEQQFALAEEVFAAGLLPIIEPEVNINSPEKAQAEVILKEELKRSLAALPAETKVVFKLTLPTEANFYQELLSDPHVLRIVALSGGYSQKEAVDILARNHGLIASFSRALAEGLSVEQNDTDFDQHLRESIELIYQGSIS